MSARTFRRGLTVLAVAAVSLLAAGCAQQPPDNKGVATSTPVVGELPHPDREPTRADVDAGTACVQVPISTLVWIEKDREYVGVNGNCKYKVDQ